MVAVNSQKMKLVQAKRTLNKSVIITAHNNYSESWFSFAIKFRLIVKICQAISGSDKFGDAVVDFCNAFKGLSKAEVFILTSRRLGPFESHCKLVIVNFKFGLICLIFTIWYLQLQQSLRRFIKTQRTRYKNNMIWAKITTSFSTRH